MKKRRIRTNLDSPKQRGLCPRGSSLRVRSFMDKTMVDRFYNTNDFNKIILFDGNVSYSSLYEENEKTKIHITYSEHHQLVEELKERRLI